LVLSPLGIERTGLAGRVAHARLAGVEFRVVGIGAQRIIAAARAALDQPGHARPHLLVLGGTAGGLTESPEAPSVTRVVNETTGHAIAIPAHPPLAPGEKPASVLGVDRLIDQPSEKRALHARHGTQVVDMESHAFAAAMSDPAFNPERVPWSVVRAVSDGPDDHLPAFVVGWFREDGTMRAGRVTWDMARHPHLVPQLLRVKARAKRALHAAGERLVAMIVDQRQRASTGAGVA
jgi:nucleoside phosphorylase